MGRQTQNEDSPTVGLLDENTEFELQINILESAGCVVIPRITARWKNIRVNRVVEAMFAMTRPSCSENYVGEFHQISGRNKVFYKCPPDQIQPQALARYGMALEDYGKQFYSCSKPGDRAPYNWLEYVEMLMRNCPYGTDEFPLETMGLDATELQVVKSRKEKMDQVASGDVSWMHT